MCLYQVSFSIYLKDFIGVNRLFLWVINCQTCTHLTFSGVHLIGKFLDKAYRLIPFSFFQVFHFQLFLSCINFQNIYFLFLNFSSCLLAKEFNLKWIKDMYAIDFWDQFQVDLNFHLNSSFNNGFCLNHYLSEIYLLI